MAIGFWVSNSDSQLDTVDKGDRRITVDVNDENGGIPWWSSG